MPELKSPWGSGTVTVPDELVEKYRADGWTFVEDETSKTPAKPPVAQRKSKTQ